MTDGFPGRVHDSGSVAPGRVWAPEGSRTPLALTGPCERLQGSSPSSPAAAETQVEVGGPLPLQPSLPHLSAVSNPTRRSRKLF